MSIKAYCGGARTWTELVAARGGHGAARTRWSPCATSDELVNRMGATGSSRTSWRGAATATEEASAAVLVL